MVTSVGQSRANDPSTINVHVPTVLRFFDEVPQDSKGHATSIASLAGEDLAAGAVKHYLETVEKCRVDVLRESVTTGRLKGGRLDRWIDVQYSDGSTVLF